MSVVAIVGSGPEANLADVTLYEAEVDIWIGADRGAFALVKRGIRVDYAVGDFDSVTAKEKEEIAGAALQMNRYAQEKDKTDLEIALDKAYELGAEKIYLFGITGGRLDHALSNVQLLRTIADKDISGIIVDRWNQLELKNPGTYTINKNKLYSYISFIPFTQRVKKITLTGFAYPLTDYDVTWGSTRLISNELILPSGTLSFEEGMLLLVQSRDNETGV